MESAEGDLLIKSFYRYIEVGIKSEDGPAHAWAVDLLNASFSKPETELSEPEKLEQFEVAWKIIIRMLELASRRRQLNSVSNQLARLIKLHPLNSLASIAEFAPQNPRLAYAVSHIHSTDAQLRERLRSLGCQWAILGFEDEIEERLQEYLKPVIEAWLLSERKPDPDREEIGWAVRAIDDDSFGNPNRCWRAILLIVAECSSKRELRCVSHHLAMLLSGNPGPHYLEVAASEVSSNRKFAYVVSKLKSADLARAGWLKLWSGIIALAEHELLDKPLTSQELQVSRRENYTGGRKDVR